jgi:hypothetical protein
MLLEHRPCNSHCDYPDEEDAQPDVLRAAVAQEDEFIAFLQKREIDDDPQFVLD